MVQTLPVSNHQAPPRFRPFPSVCVFGAPGRVRTCARWLSGPALGGSRAGARQVRWSLKLRLGNGYARASRTTSPPGPRSPRDSSRLPHAWLPAPKSPDTPSGFSARKNLQSSGLTLERRRRKLMMTRAVMTLPFEAVCAGGGRGQDHLRVGLIRRPTHRYGGTKDWPDASWMACTRAMSAAAAVASATPDRNSSLD